MSSKDGSTILYVRFPSFGSSQGAGGGGGGESGVVSAGPGADGYAIVRW